MSQDYIAGSPAGPLAAPAPPWSIAPPTLTGQDVRVLVFDSTPFTLAVGEVHQESFHGIPVTVSYPFPLQPDLPISGQSMAAHGSFVSGAVVDMAPEAQVHLVRVLNDSAIGDEFTFYQAAQQAISQTLAVSDTLAGVIMNYSFVLEISPTLSAPAMSVFLTAVSARNITQIAASGNDSAITPQPFPMLYPARHDDVVAITAVTWDTNAISCFANEGEVAVWGGGTARGNSCDTAEIINQCVNGGHPEYCVTGWDPSSPTDYAYGLGTSFSAPLVAGLAAQDIEAESSALGDWPTPGLIRSRIYDRVTHNPAPASITIGAIGTPYTVQFSIYQPFVTRN
jgi:subtilisin family serine protease